MINSTPIKRCQRLFCALALVFISVFTVVNTTQAQQITQTEEVAQQEATHPLEVVFSESKRLLTFRNDVKIYANLIFYKRANGQTIIRFTNKQLLRIPEKDMIPNSVIMYTITASGKVSDWIQPKLDLLSPSNYPESDISQLKKDTTVPIIDLGLIDSGQPYYEALGRCRQECKQGKRQITCMAKCIK